MTSRTSFPLALCLLALTLACTASSALRSTPAPTPPASILPHHCCTAHFYCQTQAAARLNHPATARFTGFTCEGPDKHGCYRVTGYVASEDIFGTTLHSRYTCHACSTGEMHGVEWYRLHDLTIKPWWPSQGIDPATGKPAPPKQRSLP